MAVDYTDPKGRTRAEMTYTDAEMELRDDIATALILSDPSELFELAAEELELEREDHAGHKAAKVAADICYTIAEAMIIRRRYLSEHADEKTGEFEWS